MPCSMQCWTTPFSRLVSCQRLSSICTAETSVMPPGLLDLTHVHIAETDALDEPFVPERVERTHARGQRRARIGRMKLIQRECARRRARAGLLRTRHADGEPFRSGTHSPFGRVRPPFVATTMRERSPLQLARARAMSLSLWPMSSSSRQYASAVSRNVTPPSNAACRSSIAARLIAIALGGQPHTPQPDRSHRRRLRADRAYSE